MRRKIELEKLTIVLLHESKCFEAELKIISNKVWKISEVIASDSKGETRGIRILWNPREVCLSAFMATHFTLSTLFQVTGTRTQGFLSNICGPSIVNKKFASSSHYLT